MALTDKLPNFLLIVAALVLAPIAAKAEVSVRIEPIVTGLDDPWGVAPMPDGGVLVTQRGGELILSRDGEQAEVDGVPEVAWGGQGGLLDVTLARDFEQSREIFLTYAKPQTGGGSGTALARARLSETGTTLEEVTQLFEMAPGSSGGRHFGSRVVEAPDGTLYMTIGERGDRPSAQDLNRHNGSVIRVNRDGSVPQDNPFVGQSDKQPEIWSYGHRNPQGAGLDANGNLWVSEHGAKGGDEVNLIAKGANYGWPVISYGRHYSGAKIGEGTSKDGMEQPQHYWDPSIAPSGLMVYSGAQMVDWAGHIFVGSLKFDYIAQLAGNPLREVAQIKASETARVRDIVEGPDGAIWFISEPRGTVYRMTPAE